MKLILIKLNVILNNVKNKLKNCDDYIRGGGEMALEVLPEWMSNLDDEDAVFMKKFLLASGSLKEIAKVYEVTYPTVRLRLDRLIQKIKLSDDNSSEPYVSLIKRMAVNDKIDFDTAKILISEYKKTRKVGE
jgi:hypothetical protein